MTIRGSYQLGSTLVPHAMHIGGRTSAQVRDALRLRALNLWLHPVMIVEVHLVSLRALLDCQGWIITILRPRRIDSCKPQSGGQGFLACAPMCIGNGSCHWPIIATSDIRLCSPWSCRRSNFTGWEESRCQPTCMMHNLR